MTKNSSVVVTGIGIFSSIGCNRQEFWNALMAGKSGIGPLQSFDPEGHKSQIAGEILSYDPREYFDRKEARKMALVSQLAVSAAIEAVKDAGMDLDKEDRSRIGCIIGSAAGDFHHIEEQYARFLQRGPRSVNPLTVPRVIANMPAGNTANALGIHGPNMGVSAACTTGTHAIGTALGLLRSGSADVILAGGTESTVTPFVMDGYASMGVLSAANDHPEKASRPFDLNRDGFVMGEGACVLVLETRAHAEKRGANVLAHVSGFGMTADAFGLAAPEPTGKWAALAIKNALNGSGVSLSEVGYINAHGTSTVMNDKTETTAIKNAFEGYDIPPVSSIKSMIGHTLGAAGAIEAAACVLALKNGCLPPTINYETEDPECDLDVIPNVARERDITAAISNSFGFGGQNGVLLFTKA